MGLDMHLYRSVYVSKYFDEGKKIQDALAVLKPLGFDPTKIKRITEEAIYWRKANHVHKWFVDNVQNGEDDCKNYYVTRDELKKLLDVVNKVLADHSKAGELLPTQSGFFFGNTDYDNFYFNDLEYTKEKIEEALAKDENSRIDWEFYYHSSW